MAFLIPIALVTTDPFGDEKVIAYEYSRNFTLPPSYVNDLLKYNLYITTPKYSQSYSPDELGISIEEESGSIKKIINLIFKRKVEYKVSIDDLQLQKVVFDINRSLNEDQKQDSYESVQKYKNRWILSKPTVTRYIDKDELSEKILSAIRSETVEIKPSIRESIVVGANLTQEEVDATKKAMVEPLYLKTSTRTFILNEQDLYRILEPTVKDGRLVISINTSTLKGLLKDKLSSLEIRQTVTIQDRRYQASEVGPNYTKTLKEIKDLINARYENNAHTNSLIVEVDKTPATKGEIFSRYVEVDLSQQMMYVWQNQQLIKRFRTSTGAENRTPVGSFKIKNKANLAWSDIAETWMPHWMAFYWHPKFKAYLGFHALTYKVDKDGKKTYEPRSHLGTPLSGGCIRLGRKEEEWFYNWAQIGDNVIIHE